MPTADSDKRVQLWSYGGGTQSVAIAALIVSGRLAPPDAVVISDTEREKSSTWDYLRETVGPALARIGLRVHRIQKRQYEEDDLVDDNGHTLMPVWRPGGLARLPGYCSDRWKRRPIQRWARDHGYTAVRSWIGYSFDERRRMRAPTTRWWHEWYPLIDLAIPRSTCVRIVEEAGWPSPPTSCCWMCPHMSNARWRVVRESPDWEKAVALDESLRRDTDPLIFVHRSGTPLATADLGSADDVAQLVDCDSGQCFL